ncbi:MAG: class I SAM-dependent methyltransferase [Paracoccaceae bacterium]
MTYDEAFEVAHCPETREAINKLREKYIRYPITKSLTAEDAFISNLVLKGRVLELGCGLGYSSKYFKECGFQVHSWESSRSMMVLAKQINGMNVVNMSVSGLEKISFYDGVFANLSMMNFTKADFEKNLKLIYRSLIPGGILHLVLKLGDGETKDALGQTITYYQEGEIYQLFSKTYFMLIENLKGESINLKGQAEPWIALQFAKGSDYGSRL